MVAFIIGGLVVIYLCDLPLVTLVRSGPVIGKGVRAGEVMVGAWGGDDVSVAGDEAGESGDGAGD